MILFVDGVFFWESCMWFCLWTEITHFFELILFSFCYTLTFLFLFAISISLKVDNVCEWVVEERGRSFRNIPRSSHLRASAHLRPQPSPDGSVGFCPLSFFFFFCFYCYDLINFKTVLLSLYSGNLIMFEFRDVWEKDCLLLWFVVFVLCLFMGISGISSLVFVLLLWFVVFVYCSVFLLFWNWLK